MKRSEAIKTFLTAMTHQDLASMYNQDMEVQINVAQDGGERIEGDYKGKMWHGWSDGLETWKSFRIPMNARTEPVDNDTNMGFNLAAHVEGIGMTGWDWRNRISRWVAFDFDAITGHSERHSKKLNDVEIKRVIDIVSNVPWITTRLSTGGKGLHLYVNLDPCVPTSNHDEHAALARSILGLLASLTGYDFQSKVDVCGGNMWVWHRKMLQSPTGLQLIKTGIPLDTVPPSWKDHVNVVSNRSRKVVPSFITDQTQADDVENLFAELTGQKTRTPLDEQHQAVIQFLHDNKLASWWDQDNHMLVTHTKFLKQAHSTLNLRGIFETNSPGTENEQNCFCYPMRNGAWVVRRYTRGIEEASTWEQDASGWTRCFFNQVPDLKASSRALGAVEHEKGGYIFREAEVASKALLSMGVATPELPKALLSRKSRLAEHKDGRIIYKIAYSEHDLPNEMEGWIQEKGWWTRIFNKPQGSVVEPEVGNCDDIVRHLITETNEDYGWLIKSDRVWRVEPLIHVRTYLKSLNLKQAETDQVLGACIAKPWRLVCRPFQPEILGDRDWNRNAPQLAFVPTATDNLEYPTWLKILKHIGKGLDEAVAKHHWCQSNGIFTGADYLKCWIASLFKEPLEPLPYLFFWGPQNSGKSIFHEALSLLVTSGITRADHALTSQSGFNGELENSVLCVVEETDLRQNKQAYNKIKDWVTSINISIRQLYQSPYMIPNTTHWLQCANDPQACPVLPGDSRITLVFVDSLPPEDLIPKKQLMTMLKKEAPDFLAAVLAVDLPVSDDRLNLPIVVTDEKMRVLDSNRTFLEVFLDEECHYMPGNIVSFADLYVQFTQWLDLDQVKNWSKIKFSRELPAKFPTARGTDNIKIVGNISFTPPPEGYNGHRLVARGNKLVPVFEDKK